MALVIRMSDSLVLGGGLIHSLGGDIGELGILDDLNVIRPFGSCSKISAITSLDMVMPARQFSL